MFNIFCCLSVSGDAIGQTFSTSGPLMTLLFSTDHTGQDRGFAIHYEMVPLNEDNSELHGCQSGFFSYGFGFVTSPDWPSPYPNDMTCHYLMTAPEGSKVMVMFAAFSTEACCDKVEIYDGPDATSPKLATLSGTELINTTFYSTQSSLFMTFYSDLTDNDKGFSAFYKEIA
ncbi:CUB domain protein [Dictyocaulus viviparus]|uniref:CUB domain protein n=1 Tax=Dictyocaulus viviparus TaxID=29172 RepID=A0A0D8YCM0_DICVI|nr:CUB domain protein [Dictyocaulus viviparus]